MAITLAQNPSVATYSGAASIGVTFGGNCTNGSRIVASVTQENRGTVTMADDSNGSYGTADVTAVPSAGTGLGEGRSSIFSKQSTATSAVTVTATLNASTAGALKCYELVDQKTTDQPDATGSNSGLGVDPPAAAHTISMTTTTDDCAVIVIGTVYPSAGLAPDAGYTQAFAAVAIINSYHYGEYRVNAGAAASFSLTEGLGNVHGFSLVGAAYKAGLVIASPVTLVTSPMRW